VYSLSSGVFCQGRSVVQIQAGRLASENPPSQHASNGVPREMASHPFLRRSEVERGRTAIDLRRMSFEINRIMFDVGGLPQRS